MLFLPTQLHTSLPIAASVALAATLSTQALAQSEIPAIFVANNGNLEGSVSVLGLNPDRSLTLLQKLVIGSVPSSGLFDPGLNASTISISPDGRLLAVGHTTASTTVEQVTILEVAADASIAIATTFTTPDSPLDVQWVANGLLATTRSALSAPNEVRIYAVDPEGSGVALVDVEPTGNFSTSLALHPTGAWLYAQDSGGGSITTFAVASNGELTLNQILPTNGVYPLGLGVSPNGAWLYGGGGISAGGKQVLAMGIEEVAGTLAPVDGAPFLSSGSSPKQVAVSGDSAWAFVGHGTDATIRSFAIDSESGALSSTGFSFDVGFQGSLGEIAISGDHLFATDRDTTSDGVRGVYSFTINDDGTLTKNGPLVDTGGIQPNSLALWIPEDSLFGDLNGDGAVDGADLGALLAAWGSADRDADLNGDGAVDGADLGLLLGAWS